MTSSSSGSGPEAQELATELAEAGLDTVGVEMHLVGGECPFYGCTPTKIMIRAADHVADGPPGRPARRPGLRLRPSGRSPRAASPTRPPRTGPTTPTPRPSRRPVCGWCAATAGWSPRAWSRSTGCEYEASRGVVLNTGTEPLVLPIDGLADTPYWTNRDVVQAHRAAPQPGRPRRWPDRVRDGAGPVPLRRRGHRHRGLRPPDRGRGARVERPAHPDLRGRGDHRAHRCRGRAGRARRLLRAHRR